MSRKFLFICLLLGLFIATGFVFRSLGYLDTADLESQETENQEEEEKDKKYSELKDDLDISLFKEETEKNDEESQVQVKSIALFSTGDAGVDWQVEGYSAEGFELIWSKTSDPAYPTRLGDKYKYFSYPEASSAIVSAFDGPGIYYVRICEYLAGQCGIYSNEIQLELK